jgi:hypothetical protein
MTTNPAPYGYFPGTGIPRKKPVPEHDGRGVCKFCGATGLVWEKRGGWMLCEVGGKVHQCRKDKP